VGASARAASSKFKLSVIFGKAFLRLSSSKSVVVALTAKSQNFVQKSSEKEIVLSIPGVEKTFRPWVRKYFLSHGWKILFVPELEYNFYSCVGKYFPYLERKIVWNEWLQLQMFFVQYYFCCWPNMNQEYEKDSKDEFIILRSLNKNPGWWPLVLQLCLRSFRSYWIREGGAQSLGKK